MSSECLVVAASVCTGGSVRVPPVPRGEGGEGDWDGKERSSSRERVAWSCLALNAPKASSSSS